MSKLEDDECTEHDKSNSGCSSSKTFPSPKSIGVALNATVVHKDGDKLLKDCVTVRNELRTNADNGSNGQTREELFYDCVTFKNEQNTNAENGSNNQRIEDSFHDCITIRNEQKTNADNRSNGQTREELFYDCVTFKNEHNTNAENGSNGQTREESFSDCATIKKEQKPNADDGSNGPQREELFQDCGTFMNKHKTSTDKGSNQCTKYATKVKPQVGRMISGVDNSKERKLNLKKVSSKNKVSRKWLKTLLLVMIINMLTVCKSLTNLIQECPEGYHVFYDKIGRSICLPCEDGKTYTPDRWHRENKCYSCTEVQIETVEYLATPCNRTHDAVILCKPGHYRQEESKTHRKGMCVPCSPCENITLACGDYHDSVCCPSDFEVIHLGEGSMYTCHKKPVFCGPQHFVNEEGECKPCPPGTTVNFDSHNKTECDVLDYHTFGSTQIPLTDTIMSTPSTDINGTNSTEDVPQCAADEFLYVNSSTNEKFCLPCMSSPCKNTTQILQETSQNVTDFASSLHQDDFPIWTIIFILIPALVMIIAIYHFRSNILALYRGDHSRISRLAYTGISQVQDST